jgi:hypothetical protein
MLITEDWHYLNKDLISTKFALQITVGSDGLLVSALLVLSKMGDRTHVSTVYFTEVFVKCANLKSRKVVLVAFCSCVYEQSFILC